MPQKIVQKPINTFVGGLITEASALNFPENASVDELNCDLKRTGVRTRRKGIEYETSFSLSTFTLNEGEPLTELTWENVSKESGVEFLVLQIGDTLYFYDKSSNPISDGIKGFTISLAAFDAGNDFDPAEEPISGDSVNGQFVVCSPAIESFIITYDNDADTVSTVEITPRVRDFEWQGNTTEYNERVAIASITDARLYDTLNSGWVGNTSPDGTNQVLTRYKSTRTAYPPLTHPWYSGKNSNGNFDVDDFEEVFGGNTLSGNGHYILDLYNKDRTAAVANTPITSETVAIDTEVESARFSTVATFAGRVWFSGLNSSKNGSKVFFSRVINNDVDYNKFYQEADPTSEDFNELVDSDGGVINIPQAHKITALFEWGSSMLVFAENGVWQITGVDDVFKATQFGIKRLRNTDGLVNTKTLVDAEGTPVWWAPSGIYTIQGNEVTGDAEGQDVSKGTIQTFWENIGAAFRATAKGVYDKRNKRVFWLYSTDVNNLYKYNGVLILDTILNAFFPWLFSDEDSNTTYVVGAEYFTGLGAEEQVIDVWTTGDTEDVWTDADTSDVVITETVSTFNDAAEIKFIIRDGDTGKITFATISNTSFMDWDTEDYSSYAEAAFDFMGDLTTYKSPMYVTCFFKVTETGWTGTEMAGYSPLTPSGCYLKAYWDLKTANSSSRQVYRFQRPIIVDSGDLSSFDYPYTSVVTRNRIRGRGKVLKLRFESESGKDFQLEGYEVINAKNQGV